MKLKQLKKQLKVTDENAKCVKCENKENLTVDHIIPQSFFNLFRPDFIRMACNNKANLQILCSTCNLAKNSFVALDQKTVDTLKRIIDKAQELENVNTDLFI